MDYTPARTLKEEFAVLGYFYNLDTVEGIRPCRNTLEIYRKSFYANAFNLNMFAEKPDALFIMMNPGSSEPKEPEFTIPEVSCVKLSEFLLEQNVIKTKPDTTQYQVMRVMEAKQWNHVRVLNLSDIRQSKSGLFVKQIHNSDSNIHSIFSLERRVELTRAINIGSNAPIVCAWGVNPGLIDLAALCLQSIPINRVVGVPAKDKLYYHPLPSLVKSQIQWLDAIMERLAV